MCMWVGKDNGQAARLCKAVGMVEEMDTIMEILAGLVLAGAVQAMFALGAQLWPTALS